MVDRDYFNVDDIKKNKMEDILNENEQILVRLNPNKKVYVLEAIFKGLPIALLWGGFDFFFIYMMLTQGVFNDNGMFLFIIIPFFALHLIPVWLYVGRVIKKVAGYKNLEYAFTTDRIIIRDGLIGIDYKFFYYHEINSVEVKVGIFDRIFKVGDLYIHSTNKQAVLDDISSPYQYANKIQNLITDLKTDMYYPNDLRPKENHGYNTRYARKDEDK